MCGRFTIKAKTEQLHEAVRGLTVTEWRGPRYNVAPTQPAPIVRMAAGARHFGLVRWGFLPGFVKDPKTFPLIINARAEGIETKPSFRAAIFAIWSSPVR